MNLKVKGKVMWFEKNRISYNKRGFYNILQNVIYKLNILPLRF